MCGIGGAYAYHPSGPALDRTALRALRERMQRRGPDGAGEWFSSDGRVALLHRRLAIIDLDARANQPMWSADGRLGVVYNGEIYNYRALRAELEGLGCTFRTQSDTEVLLQAWARWRSGMFARLRGMYALAIFETDSRELWLARDPYGIKPLYYADDGWCLQFASSVRALSASPGVSAALEDAALAGFLLTGSVPEPHTWYRDIRAVPAGHCIRIAASGATPAVAHTRLALEMGVMSPRAVDDEAALAALRDSVQSHMVADVEVGAFLSAGVDSGALVGAAAAHTPQALRTLTLRFAEFAGKPEDEGPLAAATAQRYGCRHAERLLDEREFGDAWPRLLADMDQPSIDGINTWLVSRMAHEAGLKVVLSGLGGDELLGGYPSFQRWPRWRRHAWMSWLPFLPQLCARHGGAVLERFGMHPKAAAVPALAGNWSGLYLLGRGLFLPWELPALMGRERAESGLLRLGWEHKVLHSLCGAPDSPTARVALLESSFYMRNQLLRDSDWASMAHSLELRVPLVDVALLRVLAPWLQGQGGRRGKELLARVPREPLPADLVTRPKTGFTTPIAQWMQKLPGLDGWRRHARLRRPSTPWARRYAVGLLAHWGA